MTCAQGVGGSELCGHSSPLLEHSYRKHAGPNAGLQASKCPGLAPRLVRGPAAWACSPAGAAGAAGLCPPQPCPWAGCSPSRGQGVGAPGQLPAQSPGSHQGRHVAAQTGQLLKTKGPSVFPLAKHRVSAFGTTEVRPTRGRRFNHSARTWMKTIEVSVCSRGQRVLIVLQKPIKCPCPLRVPGAVQRARPPGPQLGRPGAVSRPSEG